MENTITKFLKLTITLLLTGLLSLGLIQRAIASGDHYHDAEEESNSHSEDIDHDDHKEDAHGHREEKSARIPSLMAQKLGIKTTFAQAENLNQVITAYGALSNGPEQLSHVRARFAGLIKTVQATIGDKVAAGDLLAEVESNDSLKTYQVRAPISGLVVQRHANTGEVTQDQILFSVANFETLWAELRIYPGQQANVKEAQVANILVNDLSLKGTVSHVIPALDKPYQLARIKLQNRGLGLSPGLLVEGRVVTDSFTVPLAITKDAIQSVGGRAGVFVKHMDSFEFVPLVFGRADDQFFEVLNGLKKGEEYVSQNSYLIKADIEKSEAEHEH